MEILIHGQWCIQVKHFYVNARVIGYNTIPKNIGCGGVSSMCAHITSVLMVFLPTVEWVRLGLYF